MLAINAKHKVLKTSAFTKPEDSSAVAERHLSQVQEYKAKLLNGLFRGYTDVNEGTLNIDLTKIEVPYIDNSSNVLRIIKSLQKIIKPWAENNSTLAHIQDSIPKDLQHFILRNSDKLKYAVSGISCIIPNTLNGISAQDIFFDIMESYGNPMHLMLYEIVGSCSRIHDARLMGDNPSAMFIHVDNICLLYVISRMTTCITTMHAMMNNGWFAKYPAGYLSIASALVSTPCSDNWDKISVKEALWIYLSTVQRYGLELFSSGRQIEMQASAESEFITSTVHTYQQYNIDRHICQGIVDLSRKTCPDAYVTVNLPDNIVTVSDIKGLPGTHAVYNYGFNTLVRHAWMAFFASLLYCVKQQRMSLILEANETPGYTIRSKFLTSDIPMRELTDTFIMATLPKQCDGVHFDCTFHVQPKYADKLNGLPTECRAMRIGGSNPVYVPYLRAFNAEDTMTYILVPATRRAASVLYTLYDIPKPSPLLALPDRLAMFTEYMTPYYGNIIHSAHIGLLHVGYVDIRSFCTGEPARSDEECSIDELFHAFIGDRN